MRTAARRTAAVLLLALVAMLLVATGGTARGTQHRVSAGAGQAAVSPQAGRHVVVQAAPQPDQPAHLPDLASTPPSEASHQVDDTAWTTVATDVTPYAGTAGVAPIGRAPPAL